MERIVESGRGAPCRMCGDWLLSGGFRAGPVPRSTMAMSSRPRQTGHAVFPHPAFRRVMPSPTEGPWSSTQGVAGRGFPIAVRPDSVHTARSWPSLSTEPLSQPPRPVRGCHRLASLTCPRDSGSPSRTASGSGAPPCPAVSSTGVSRQFAHWPCGGCPCRSPCRAECRYRLPHAGDSCVPRGTPDRMNISERPAIAKGKSVWATGRRTQSPAPGPVGRLSPLWTGRRNSHFLDWLTARRLHW